MDRVTATDMDKSVCQINGLGGAKHQPRSSKSGESNKVNHEVIPAIVTGDKAWQHAGVGSFWTGIDQSQPRTGKRIHAPISQDQRVSVAATDQDKFLRKRKCSLHHAVSSRGGCRWGPVWRGRIRFLRSVIKDLNSTRPATAVPVADVMRKRIPGAGRSINWQTARDSIRSPHWPFERSHSGQGVQERHDVVDLRGGQGRQIDFYGGNLSFYLEPVLPH